MRCEDLKRRIIEDNSELNSEELEHIQNCSECAETMKAHNLIIQTISDNPNDEPSIAFEDFRTQFEATTSSRNKLEKIMSDIKNQFNTYPKAITGIGLAVVAFLFIVFVPFTYDTVIGYRISLCNIEKNAVISSDKLEAALLTMGYDGIDITSTPIKNGVEFQIYGLTDISLADKVASTISSIYGCTNIENLEPIITGASGTLYARVASKIESNDSEQVLFSLDSGAVLINGENISQIVKSGDLSNSEVRDSLEIIISYVDGEKSDIPITIAVESDDSGRYLILIPDEEQLNSSELDVIEMVSSGSEMYLRYIDNGFSEDSISKYNINLRYSEGKVDTTIAAPVLKIYIDKDK